MGTISKAVFSERENDRSKYLFPGLDIESDRRFDEVFEAHKLLEEGETNIAGRAVSLLGDVNFQNPLVLAGLVHLRAVQEHDGVGVLFNGA